MRPSHLMLVLPTHPGTSARTGKPWSRGQRFAVQGVGQQRIRVHRLFDWNDPAESLLRRFRVQSYQQHTCRVVPDSGQGQHVAQGRSHPFAVADASGLPLGARGSLCLHYVEHGAMVASAFQVAHQNAGRQAEYIGVGQFQRIGYSIAFDGETPSVRVEVQADRVVADEEVVGWGLSGPAYSQGGPPGSYRRAR